MNLYCIIHSIISHINISGNNRWKWEELETEYRVIFSFIRGLGKRPNI